LQAAEVSIQRFVAGTLIAGRERLIQIARQPLALGGIPRQPACKLAHERFGKRILTRLRAGNLVIQPLVVVGCRGDAAHCELAQGFAGNLEGVAECGHARLLPGSGAE